MRQKPIPKPLQGQSWWDWATKLVAALNVQQTEDNLRRPVALAHKLPGDQHSAAEDGIVMYDPVLKKAVISIDGAWVPLH